MSTPNIKVEIMELGPSRPLPTEFCATCHHPKHDYGPCDVVKTSARIGWSSRCECSDY